MGMCCVQEIRRKQLEVMLNALLRRYVEGDVEGFRVSLPLLRYLHVQSSMEPHLRLLPRE